MGKQKEKNQKWGEVDGVKEEASSIGKVKRMEKSDQLSEERWSDYLGIKSLLDADSSLNLGLASLNLRHQSLDVLQLTASFPEHARVLHHLHDRQAVTCSSPGQLTGCYLLHHLYNCKEVSSPSSSLFIKHTLWVSRYSLGRHLN